MDPRMLDYYNRELANELKLMGFLLKLDWADKANYYRELQLVISRSKSWVTQMAGKEKDLQLLLKKTKGEGYARKDFISINSNLSRFMKYHINNAITVAEWCDLVTKYQEYVEVVNAESNKVRA